MAGQVDEIKARLDIVDVVSEYIRLKQAGMNNWKGLCPFHNEKSPSFMVSKDKQIFHCFGCGEGGDIFTFVQKMEGLEFVEALRILAQKAGIKLEVQDPKLASQKNRLMDICKAAADFWHNELLDSKEAEFARKYLQSRGVLEKTTNEFKLGYAADSWDKLLKHLKSKKYSEEEIFLAGLAVKKDRGQGFYDRFRARLMFPINDFHGSPIGFSARALKEDEKGGKYINTPQTLIYNKSLVIFNLDKAKTAIKKLGYAILVEGQMDALSAFQAGTENVIATSGTALTTDQLLILKRYSPNLMIAFDTDVAGESAAKRGIELALAEEMNVKVIDLPEGKDPDEAIKNNPEIWFDSIKNAKSIMQYYFDQTFAKNNLKEVEGKKQAAKTLLPVINKIKNQIEQVHWLQKLAEAINVSEEILRKTLQGVKPEAGKSEKVQLVKTKSRDEMLYENILAIALGFPVNITYLVDNLPLGIIENNQLSALYKTLIIYYTEDIKGDPAKFNYQNLKSKISDASLHTLVDRLILLAEKDFFDFNQDEIRQELIKSIIFCKKNYYTSRLKKIEGRIKEAENKHDHQEVERLSEQFNEVIAQLNILE